MAYTQSQQGKFAQRTTVYGRRASTALGLMVGLLVVPAPAHARGGALDRSFGVDGKVTTDFAGLGGRILALVVQPDGKLVAAGGSSAHFALARYNRDGSLDRGFGVDGRVTTEFGDPDGANALVLQADGKLVAAGVKATFQGERLDFALARYNRDGTLDTGFGDHGKLTTDFGADDTARALVVQADGKLVAAGNTVAATPPYVNSFALARYNPNGTLDTSFGAGGHVITTGPDIANALVVQADGRLVAAGVANLTTNSQFALARYNRDGTLDTHFGAGGKVVTSFGGDGAWISALVVQDGRLTAAGSTNLGSDTDFALARYNRDGTLDTHFGVGGKVTTHFAATNDDRLNALVVEHGKLVAAGNLSTWSTPDYDFGLARYNRDGTLDARFGVGGTVVTDFAGGVDEANALAVQPDGRLVAAGTASIADQADFALARYKAGRT
ncbi:MAG: hypothetical protein V7603_2610 [Micromonosporaceae bacterium]